MKTQFSRLVIDTGTVRKMDRDETERALIDIGQDWANDDTDDQLRDLLVSSVRLDEARCA